MSSLQIRHSQPITISHCIVMLNFASAYSNSERCSALLSIRFYLYTLSRFIFLSFAVLLSRCFPFLISFSFIFIAIFNIIRSNDDIEQTIYLIFFRCSLFYYSMNWLCSFYDCLCFCITSIWIVGQISLAHSDSKSPSHSIGLNGLLMCIKLDAQLN